MIPNWWAEGLVPHCLWLCGDSVLTLGPLVDTSGIDGSLCPNLTQPRVTCKGGVSTEGLTKSDVSGTMLWGTVFIAD